MNTIIIIIIIITGYNNIYTSTYKLLNGMREYVTYACIIV